MTDSDRARVLAATARALQAPASVQDTLEAIIGAVAVSVPGIDHAGISAAHRDGSIETRAATGQLVWTLDKVQYDLGEGPCVYAMRDHGVVVVEHARHEQRWPRYMARALQEGLRSQLAIQLYVDDTTLGGLNLYSQSSDTLSRDTVEACELFATYAALALGRARKEEQLGAAIATRTVIGQATGIVMERYGLPPDRAFAFLARQSSTANIKLRDVAQEVVDGRDGGHGGPAPQ